MKIITHSSIALSFALMSFVLFQNCAQSNFGATAQPASAAQVQNDSSVVHASSSNRSPASEISTGVAAESSAALNPSINSKMASNPIHSGSSNMSCGFSLSGGATGATQGLSRNACISWCETSASNNPNENLICNYQGVELALGSALGSQGATCQFSLSGGASGSTAGLSQKDCADWCHLNGSQNPAESLACSYNTTPVSL